MPTTAPRMMSRALTGRKASPSERRLHAFAEIISSEREHPEKSRAPLRGRWRRCLDVALIRRAVRPWNGERGSRYRRDKSQNAFPERFRWRRAETARRADAQENREPDAVTARMSSWRPLLRIARLMATIRKASRPSRSVMTNACSIRDRLQTRLNLKMMLSYFQISAGQVRDEELHDAHGDSTTPGRWLQSPVEAAERRGRCGRASSRTG